MTGRGWGSQPGGEEDRYINRCLQERGVVDEGNRTKGGWQGGLTQPGDRKEQGQQGSLPGGGVVTAEH